MTVRMVIYLSVLAALMIVGCHPKSRPTARSPAVTAQQGEVAAVRLAKAQADVRNDFGPAISFAFGNCGDPCIVKFNGGGSVLLYAVAAEGFLSGARKGLIIDGPCASACALAADLANEVTCITPNAIFGFHLTSDGTEPPHSPALAAFVRSHGGFPSQESGIMNWMPNAAARIFWSQCRPLSPVRR